MKFPCILKSFVLVQCIYHITFAVPIIEGIKSDNKEPIPLAEIKTTNSSTTTEKLVDVQVTTTSEATTTVDSNSISSSVHQLQDHINKDHTDLDVNKENEPIILIPTNDIPSARPSLNGPINFFPYHNSVAIYPSNTRQRRIGPSSRSEISTSGQRNNCLNSPNCYINSLILPVLDIEPLTNAKIKQHRLNSWRLSKLGFVDTQPTKIEQQPQPQQPQINSRSFFGLFGGGSKTSGQNIVINNPHTSGGFAYFDGKKHQPCRLHENLKMPEIISA